MPPLRAYYERGMERERLSDGRGELEFTGAVTSGCGVAS